MSNLRIFHRNFTVLEFVTLFFKKLTAVLVERVFFLGGGEAAPSRLKYFEILRKIVRIECTKLLKSRKKIITKNNNKIKCGRYS